MSAEGGKVETDRWYHVVGTYDGGVLRLFVDGALAGAVDVDNVVQGALAAISLLIVNMMDSLHSWPFCPACPCVIPFPFLCHVVS